MMQRLSSEVRARILEPLGLRRTSAPGERPFLPARHAKAYQQWAPGGALTDTTLFNPTVAAASSLITTPTDQGARGDQPFQRVS